MELDFGSLNWLAIGVSVVVGQVFLTVWFAVLFAEPWARAYGAANKAEHAAAIPGYTYGVGLICMFLLTVGLALLQANMGIAGIGGGITSGLVIAVCLALATALPGYAFLGRWNAAVLAIGSQCALIVILSVLLSVWK